MKRVTLAVIVWVGALTGAGQAMAHHSFAMFDANKTETISGTVKEFQFTNPHSWLQVVAADKTGAVYEWSLEMNNLLGLRRAGWRAGSVKPGDKVTVAFHPMRDGTHAGQLISVTLGDGTVLNGQGNGFPPMPNGN